MNTFSFLRNRTLPMKLKSLLATHCHPISSFFPRGCHCDGLNVHFLKTCKYIVGTRGDCMVSLTQMMRILSFPFHFSLRVSFCIDLDFIDIIVTEWNVNIIHHNVKDMEAGRQQRREAGQRTDRDAGGGTRASVDTQWGLSGVEGK